MASPLYDRQTVTDRKDEAAGTSKADEKAKMEKDEKGEDRGLTMAMQGADKLIQGLKALHKTHETERKDYHNNHREALRQMSGRHEKQIKDLYSAHMGEKPEAQMEEEA